MALRRPFFLFASLAALIVGCGPSGTALPTSPANPNRTTVSVTAAGSTTVLPILSGFVPTITLPQGTVPTATTATFTTTLQSPVGAPVLQTFERQAKAASASSALLFVQLQFSSGVTLNSQLGFSFTIPSNVDATAGPFYIAFYDPSGTASWQYATEGPGVVSDRTVRFTAAPKSIVFNANTTYVYAFYQLKGPLATPVLGAAPGSVSFTAPNQSATITVTGVSGSTVSAASSSTASAAVSPASATLVNGSATFTVTSGTTGGAPTLTFTDNLGRTATTSVSVTITGGTVH